MVQDNDYLSVKDVTDILNTDAYVLRFYEKELHLAIKRNEKGYRMYTLEDVELFRKIQEMRQQGLQLKAIETIIHDKSSNEAKETYQQLSSLAVTSHSITPIENTTPNVDITDQGDEKVKQFSFLMKEMFKQALEEYNEQNNIRMKEEIKEEVESAIDEKISAIKKEQLTDNEVHYKKVDESIRELQKLRKELSEVKGQAKPQKSSFLKNLFKGKHQTAEM